MAKIKTYKIIVQAVTLNGVKCRCPEIEFISQAPCLSAGCTYDKDTGTITVSATDECIKSGEACLTYRIKCAEGDCLENVVTVCLCGDDGDCEGCAKCINNVCTKVCPDEQCFEGNCKDCAEDANCPCNQVCIQGDCTCPRGEFIDGDCCVECNDTTVLDNCQVCIGGKIVTKDCPDGVCDPETGECVDCCRDGDCSKANEACKEKVCECDSGYVRDNCTGECVPKLPEACLDENDCPDCGGCTNIDPCTNYGVCSTKKCPQGFICVDGECVEECDCNNPKCSNVSDYCAALNLFECYCKSCPVVSCSEDAAACAGGSGNNCECVDGECVPKTDDEETDTGPCETKVDLNIIEDSCDLEGVYTDECCPCPEIEVKITPTATNAYSLTMFKDGVALADYQLDNNIAANEPATSGKYNAIVYNKEVTYIETFDGRLIELGTEEVEISNSYSNEFNGTDDTYGILTNILFAPGEVIASEDIEFQQSAATRIVVVEEILVQFWLDQTYFKGTECTYNRQLIHSEIYSSSEDFLTENREIALGTIVSEGCKNPLFIWRKDDVVIRKLYIPGDGVYTDTLYGPDSFEDDKYPLVPSEGLLESCHDYSLEVDCDCAAPKEEYVVFCKTVEDFTSQVVAGRECSDQITYTIPSTCDVNKDLTFRVTATTINGSQIIDSYLGSELAVTKVLTAVTNDCFESIKLEMFCANGSVACTNEINFDSTDPEVTATYNCPNSISFSSTGATINRVSVLTGPSGAATLTANQTYPIPSGTNSGSISYEVTFNNCNKIITDTLSFTCTCAGDPCNGRACGSVVDGCGSSVNCGQVPNAVEVSNGCCRNGFECFTKTEYYCDGSGNLQTTVTQREQANSSCDTTVSYNCVGTSCTPVSGSGGQYETDEECRMTCGITTIDGCTDQLACNYNSNATDDDGSCYSNGDPCSINNQSGVYENCICAIGSTECLNCSLPIVECTDTALTFNEGDIVDWVVPAIQLGDCPGATINAVSGDSDIKGTQASAGTYQVIYSASSDCGNASCTISITVNGVGCTGDANEDDIATLALLCGSSNSGVIRVSNPLSFTNCGTCCDELSLTYSGVLKRDGDIIRTISPTNVTSACEGISLEDLNDVNCTAGTYIFETTIESFNLPMGCTVSNLFDGKVITSDPLVVTQPDLDSCSACSTCANPIDESAVLRCVDSSTLEICHTVSGLEPGKLYKIIVGGSADKCHEFTASSDTETHCFNGLIISNTGTLTINTDCGECENL